MKTSIKKKPNADAYLAKSLSSNHIKLIFYIPLTN